jgi:two-component system chemotaxis response regulator CheY
MAKIMVVDASVIRKWCNRTLTEAGHRVIEAIDGREAVRLYQAENPDGVLTDITMPEMNGIDALRAIRKVDPNARVAMLTVLGKMDVVVEARKLGTIDFVLKPCEASRLIEAMQRILA